MAGLNPLEYLTFNPDLFTALFTISASSRCPKKRAFSSFENVISNFLKASSGKVIKPLFCIGGLLALSSRVSYKTGLMVLKSHTPHPVHSSSRQSTVRALSFDF